MFPALQRLREHIRSDATWVSSVHGRSEHDGRRLARVERAGHLAKETRPALLALSVNILTPFLFFKTYKYTVQDSVSTAEHVCVYVASGTEQNTCKIDLLWVFIQP